MQSAFVLLLAVAAVSAQFAPQTLNPYPQQQPLGQAAPVAPLSAWQLEQTATAAGVTPFDIAQAVAQAQQQPWMIVEIADPLGLEAIVLQQLSQQATVAQQQTGQDVFQLAQQATALAAQGAAGLAQPQPIGALNPFAPQQQQLGLNPYAQQQQLALNPYAQQQQLAQQQLALNPYAQQQQLALNPYAQQQLAQQQLAQQQLAQQQLVQQQIAQQQLALNPYAQQQQLALNPYAQQQQLLAQQQLAQQQLALNPYAQSPFLQQQLLLNPYVQTPLLQSPYGVRRIPARGLYSPQVRYAQSLRGRVY